MWQSITIFVVILLVQAIAAASAKKKEAEKKAAQENLRLGRTAESVQKVTPPKRMEARMVVTEAPKNDRFQAAQARAQRHSEAHSPLGSPKPIEVQAKKFTSVVGSIHDVPKVEEIDRDSNRRRPVQIQKPIHMPSFHVSEGEASASQLAKTVSAIRAGMLQGGSRPIAPRPKAEPAHVRVSGSFRLGSLRSAQKLREAILLSEILGPPVALR